jgi:hypothetical protein
MTSPPGALIDNRGIHETPMTHVHKGGASPEAEYAIAMARQLHELARAAGLPVISAEVRFVLRGRKSVSGVFIDGRQT